MGWGTLARYAANNFVRCEVQFQEVNHYFINPQFSRQVLGALDSMHSQSLLHRDIKELNVIVFPDESPLFPILKLIDFGLVQPLGTSGPPFGTAGVILLLRSNKNKVRSLSV
jgi:serine/threonine protein kinase